MTSKNDGSPSLVAVLLVTANTVTRTKGGMLCRLVFKKLQMIHPTRTLLPILHEPILPVPSTPTHVTDWLHRQRCLHLTTHLGLDVWRKGTHRNREHHSHLHFRWLSHLHVYPLDSCSMLGRHRVRWLGGRDPPVHGRNDVDGLLHFSIWRW